MVAKSKPKAKTEKSTKGLAKAAPVEKVEIMIPSGISADLQVEDVPREDINLEERRFQFRVDCDNFKDIVNSFKEQGQQSPVVLWGKKKPYLIIDGHRRARAAEKLGMPSLKAIIRKDLSEEQAYQIAYLENSKRKSFNKLDQANALWILHHQQKKTIQDASAFLGIDKNKATTLLQLLEMDPAIQKAVRDEIITMHHAMILRKHDKVDIKATLAQIVEEKLSARSLGKKLGKAKIKGRKKTYFKKEENGFSLPPIKFSAKTATESMRKNMIAALEKALEVMKSAAPEAEDGEAEQQDQKGTE